MSPDRLTFEDVGNLKVYFWERVKVETSVEQRRMFYDLYCGACWWLCELRDELRFSRIDALNREPLAQIEMARVWAMERSR